MYQLKMFQYLLLPAGEILKTLTAILFASYYILPYNLQDHAFEFVIMIDHGELLNCPDR